MDLETTVPNQEILLSLDYTILGCYCSQGILHYIFDKTWLVLFSLFFPSSCEYGQHMQQKCKNAIILIFST